MFSDLVGESPDLAGQAVAYQDEDVLISFNRTYSKTGSNGDKFFIELKLKILANNKIISIFTPVGIKVLDNFGNDLQYLIASPFFSGNLRPGEEKLLTIGFSIKPLENTEYLLLKIPGGINYSGLGNIKPFELKIVKPLFEPQIVLEEDIRPTPKQSFEDWQKENAQRILAEREANKRQLIAIVVSVVVLLAITVCITWLLISKRKRIKLFIKTLFNALYRPKVILWTGIFVIVAMCLFPPWADKGRMVGYAYLFSDGNFQQFRRGDIRAHIDLVRLLIQCAIVGLITGGLLYTLKDKKAEGAERCNE